MRHSILAAAFVVAVVSAPAMAETPRELLVSAAFGTRDKGVALAKIEAAIKEADAILAHNPGDHEAKLQRAVAISYRGKLTRSRADVTAARRAFEALVAANPRDAEAQMALAGWHLGAVIELGPMLARTALGARKARGVEALEQAVALGASHAFFPAFASLNRIQLDPRNVAAARNLAEAAVKARATTPLDRVMQRNAAVLLKALRGGDGKASAALAKALLPFGRLAR